MPTDTQELTRADVMAAALAVSNQSQARIAKALGVAEATISRWKTGEATPEVEGALMLAQLTSLPMDGVLRAFGKDPERLGLAGSPAAVPPPSYDLRLLRVGEMLARVAQEVMAIASGSQVDYDPKGPGTLIRDNQHSAYQDRRVGVLQFPRLWERRLQAAAS